MRCDKCPLCPIAEDDVCIETEGKYGIVHSYGMLGCGAKMENEEDL